MGAFMWVLKEELLWSNATMRHRFSETNSWITFQNLCHWHFKRLNEARGHILMNTPKLFQIIILLHALHNNCPISMSTRPKRSCGSTLCWHINKTENEKRIKSNKTPAHKLDYLTIVMDFMLDFSAILSIHYLGEENVLFTSFFGFIHLFYRHIICGAQAQMSLFLVSCHLFLNFISNRYTDLFIWYVS